MRSSASRNPPAVIDPLLPVALSRSGRSLTSLKGCARSLDRLLNYVVRSREHRGGDREAHGFRGPQINHQLDLRRLLHRKIGRLSSSKHFVDIACDAFVVVAVTQTIADEATCLHVLAKAVYSREFVFVR